MVSFAWSGNSGAEGFSVRVEKNGRRRERDEARDVGLTREGRETASASPFVPFAGTIRLLIVRMY